MVVDLLLNEIDGVWYPPRVCELVSLLSDGSARSGDELAQCIFGADGGTENAIKQIAHRARAAGLPVRGEAWRGYRLSV